MHETANPQEDKPMITEYKGNPMIVLNPFGKFKFQFGLSKARLILAHIDAIKAFVADNPKTEKAPALTKSYSVQDAKEKFTPMEFPTGEEGPIERHS